MDIEIQTQHVDLQPEWRALIDERLSRLLERYPKLIRVHVTLKHGPHHLHGAEQVDIVATCPGATLRAAKQEEEMRDALHAALDVLERELVAHHEERHHFGKPPGPRPSGTIARIFRDRGYGFIVTDGGEEVYSTATPSTSSTSPLCKRACPWNSRSSAASVARRRAASSPWASACDLMPRTAHAWHGLR